MTFLHQIDPIALSLGPAQGPLVRPDVPAGVRRWPGGWAAAASAPGRLPGVDEQAFGDLLFYGMLGVVLGGRIGYILFYAFDELLDDPLMLLRDLGRRHELPRRPARRDGRGAGGGRASSGLHFFDTMDFVAPLVPPGLGFGRLGNYIGGELWGKHTDAGWGVMFPTRCRSSTPARRCERAARSCTPAARWTPSRAIRRSSTRPFLEGAGDVRGAVVVLAQAAAALRGVGPVRAAVRRVPLRWSSSCACPTRSSATSPSAG